MQSLLPEELASILSKALAIADQPTEDLDLDDIDLDFDFESCPSSEVSAKEPAKRPIYGRNAVKISIRLHPHTLKKIREKADATGQGYQKLINAMLRGAVAAWSKPNP